MDTRVRCVGCNRTVNDWIEVDGVQWEPNFRKVRGEWRCWACRKEQRHPSMREAYMPEGFKVNEQS
jgi:hypothetical protein